MADSKKISVLHIALNPVTGPWSVMRDLALAQSKSGFYQAVGVGIVHSKNWPEQYGEELKNLGLPYFKAQTLEAFGTAQFFWQRMQKPPIGAWAQELAKQSGADRVVVHFHNAWMSGVFLPLQTAPAFEALCVATFHGVNTVLGGRPIRRWLHRKMAARLPHYGARLTSVDAGNLSLAESILRLNPASFFIIQNGVADDSESKCAAWTGEGEFIIGHVGNITEHKGWKLAAEAVLRLKNEGLRIRLLIAGTGADVAEARQMAQASNGTIEFLGHVTQPRKDLFPRLHLLSVMSRHEGLPMTIIEAMASGVPVVATAVGGIPEAIADGKNGFLIPRTGDALSEAVKKLYASPQTWRAINAAARERFLQQFEISKIVSAYHSVYNS